MPSLLSLPRELRDLIYHSLLTSPPPSSPRFLTPPSPSCPLITPLPPPGPSALAYPLLLTSHQLHTELSTLIHTLSTRQPPSYTLTLHIISETHIRPHWTHVPFLSSHLERLSITIAQSGARDGESRSVFMPARGTPATSATFVSHFLALMRAILHTATIGTLDISIPLPSPLPPGGLIPAHPIRRRLEPNRGALVHPRIVGDALSVNVDYFLQNPTGREEEESFRACRGHEDGWHGGGGEGVGFFEVGRGEGVSGGHDLGGIWSEGLVGVVRV
ncbi:hypothetical protein M501DRAFT_314197 [Patellaria atrata CBS 101060]|uniref:F-box domain-containing protein n=1 Tax=Patellaria atrata CBS 101060 TaxID=1346257 RepID=A0A9P4VK35_9PEZI|nr:hypothetical protein M501DRAFT_314197 [Patellaria atrata CBS 101060]